MLSAEQLAAKWEEEALRYAQNAGHWQERAEKLQADLAETETELSEWRRVFAGQEVELERLRTALKKHHDTFNPPPRCYKCGESLEEPDATS